jgi:hypothetical protein
MNSVPARSVFAFCVDAMGAIGQSYILYHDLRDTYPYKVMSFPPAEFYKQIAAMGVFIAPILGIFVGALFLFKKHWIAFVLPVAVCPAVFAMIFLAMTFVRKLNGTEDLGRNFDGTDPNGVAMAFAVGAFVLAAVGTLIGLGVNKLLSIAFRDKDLP